MKKTIFLAASAAFFVSGACASDVIPNHIRHPLHAAAVKMLAPKSVVRMGVAATAGSSSPAYSPTLAPGGLSNANVIAGLSWSAQLGDTATYADNSVQQADIGSTVAGLDDSGNVTAPVETTAIGASSSVHFGTSLARRTYAGSAVQQPLILAGAAPNSDPNNDLSSTAPWSDLFQIGGTQADSKGFFAVYGQPYGGSNYAVVDQISMNGMSSAQGTGVSAGPSSTQVYNVNYDAAARGTLAGSAPPKFIASSAIKDPSGNSHAVTFTATGAKFSPALPAYWAAMLRKNMTVTTNEIGISSEHDPVNNWNDPASKNMAKTFRMFSGTITGWDANSDGTVSEITVDKWIVMYQSVLSGIYKFTIPSSTIPGTNTVDGSTPELDTDRTDIVDSSGTVQPAVFFGVYTKAFDRYTECVINPNQARGDLNNPNGTIGDQVRECQGEEMDLWNNDSKDYDASLHGLTITAANMANTHVTGDSYLVDLQGAGMMPVGLRVHNIEDGGADIEGWQNGGNTHWSIFSPVTLPLASGSVEPLMTLQQALAGTGSVLGTVAWKTYRDTTATGSTDNWSTASVHLQFKVTDAFTASSYPQDETGSIGGQLVMNPSGYEWGIGLGAGGGFQNPNYGVIVDVGGLAHLPNGGTTGPGKNFTANAFVTENSSGDSSATFGTDTSGDAVIGSAVSGGILVSQIPYSDIHVTNGHNFVFNTSSGGNGAYISGDDNGNLLLHSGKSGGGGIYGATTVSAQSGVFSSGLTVPFGTPASAAAVCTQGEMEMDATYIYSCVATNTWHRVSNGGTW